MGKNDWTYKQCKKNINEAVKVLEQKATETTDESYIKELETAKQKLNEVKQKIIEMYQTFPEYLMLTKVEVITEDCGKSRAFMYNGDHVSIDWEFFRHQETFKVYLKDAA